MDPDDTTALQQLQQDEDERRHHDSNQGQEEVIVVLAYVNTWIAFHHQILTNKQGSTIRERDARKAKKEANKMKSL